MKFYKDINIFSILFVGCVVIFNTGHVIFGIFVLFVVIIMITVLFAPGLYTIIINKGENLN